ncbi:MAG: VIT1/CCC1 transporter family protein [Candidatus Hodarchaeota archaeon]
MNFLRSFGQLYKISECGSITRRYTVIGAFDGALTVLGIILGAVIASVDSATVVVSGGIGGIVALGISSAWGALEIEILEQKRRAKEDEDAMLVRIENSIHTRAATFATYWSAFVHGIAPVPAGLIPLLPFFFIPDLILAATVATAIALFMLFSLGFVMGYICDESGIYYGGRMMLAGLVTTLALLILGIQHI